MNYKDKNIINIENDELNIKSHLNASLDLSGISVSEDLINRTLEAIRKQSAEQEDNWDGSGYKKETRNNNGKVIPWNRYIRGFASVAAAALIIVAGYGLLNSLGQGKKSMESPTDRSIYDTAATQTPQEFAANTAEDAAPSDNWAIAKSSEGGALGITSAQDTDESVNSTDAVTTQPQFTVTADTSLAAEGEGSTGSAGIAAAGEADSQSDAPVKNTDGVPALTFRDIFLPDPAQSQSLTITDNVNGTAITLTDQNAILDFYSIMDQYQFTYSTKTDAQTNYTAVITASQEVSYTMVIGNNIAVSYMDKNVASQSIYSASDNAQLLVDLNNFMIRYKQ